MLAFHKEIRIHPKFRDISSLKNRICKGAVCEFVKSAEFMEIQHISNLFCLAIWASLGTLILNITGRESDYDVISG